ncbi:hypothetical protein SRABI102_02560 [Stenotrophomonas lactitubi]|nr:hypothetical protein SRABI122_02006 [Stenotrophomonas lactitubi]CAH0232425.1 hypothetical protein SRABI81_02726 [Stenotrophomonas lactitubi]CAH0232427.1 hypothetical protein SRABI102_02560 [Stenotrophomonas lactitubi]CAH0254312.1 hypothetical protein SRABI66_03278 [Stenotrophomonas lactitubi]
MWLLDRLSPPRPVLPVETPPPAADTPSRRTPLKRPLRVSRASMAPWQKIAPPPRRSRH